MKLKISGPMQSETQAEKQETHQQIDVDRQLYLQVLFFFSFSKWYQKTKNKK